MEQISSTIHLNVPVSVISLYLTCDCQFQVSAEDKASGKAQKITITSDKGRLSSDEIERMVKEAEENAEIDRIARQNVEAKNQLEAYLYNLRASVTDSLKDKISEDDKTTILSKVTEVLAWLEENSGQDKETYDAKRKEVEDIAGPVIAKAYSAASSSASGAASSTPSSDNSDGGPTVEEM